MIRVYLIDEQHIQAVKNVLEQEATKDASGEWRENPFKKQGYLLMASQALGMEVGKHYLLIDADEKFFQQHESRLIEAGAKPVVGKDTEKIKQKMLQTEKQASEGLGFVFG